MDDKIVGKHIYGSFYGLEEKRAYDDVEFMKNLVKDAAIAANATIIDIKVWKIEGKKGGISALVLVDESHIAIHTWKEYDYATYDIYTCGSHTDPWKAYDLIKERLKPKRWTVNYSDRSQL